MTRAIPLIVAGVLLLRLSIPCHAAPDPLPTQDEIRLAYQGGQFQQVLQKLPRVLVLKGKAAANYNRHELLRIKGETHLRLKASGPAAQAFAEASKEAPDGTATAYDIAVELLIRRSSVMAYTPKAKDPADKTKALPPIDILEPENRGKAIRALFTDEWAASEPKIRAANEGRTLPPILEALPTIRNLRWLDLAANGNDEKSKAQVAGLVSKAQKLLNAGLKDMSEETDTIERLSNEVVDSMVPMTDSKGKPTGLFDRRYKRRGPDRRQASTLDASVGTCGKIIKSCDELGGTLGSDGKEFEAIKTEATRIASKAQALLNANWRQVFLTPPPPVLGK